MSLHCLPCKDNASWTIHVQCRICQNKGGEVLRNSGKESKRELGLLWNQEGNQAIIFQYFLVNFKICQKKASSNPQGIHVYDILNNNSLGNTCVWHTLITIPWGIHVYNIPQQQFQREYMFLTYLNNNS